MKQGTKTKARTLRSVTNEAPSVRTVSTPAARFDLLAALSPKINILKTETIDVLLALSRVHSLEGSKKHIDNINMCVVNMLEVIRDAECDLYEAEPSESAAE